jgi:hypothetical protein
VLPLVPSPLEPLPAAPFVPELPPLPASFSSSEGDDSPPQAAGEPARMMKAVNARSDFIE